MSVINKVTSATRCSIALSLAILGCGARRESNTGVSDPSLAKATPLPAPTVVVSQPSKPSEAPAVGADNSLTTDEYMDLGMPSPERKWTSSDFEAAAKVIANISQTDLSQLPRYHSSKSGEMFERMVNPENLNDLGNRSMPIDFRILEVNKFMQAANTVNRTYLASLLKMSTGDDEMTEITGLTLRVAVVMIQTIDEFLPSLDPNSPTYSTRMDGLKQTRSGMANMMLGTIKQVSQPETWKAEPLGRFIRNMDDTFPVMITSVPGSVRKEVQGKLKILAGKPGLGPNQQAFDEMVSKVSRAAESAAE